MSDPLRLVVFDVDGTLVDSQADILRAMTLAFEGIERDVPSRADILGIVGLSLPQAMALLAPLAPPIEQAQLVEEYKSAYVTMRAQTGAAASSPLYPGAMALLKALQANADVLLGVATGKSKRGLDKLIEAHALQEFFVTRQVADFHPSKPHPSMLLQAMAEAGVDPEQTVMVGDTSYDMEMAAAAGVTGVGVSWGYHAVDAMRDARHIVDDFSALPAVLDMCWNDHK